MNTKTDAGMSVADKLMLVVTGGIVIGGLYGYYYFAEQSVLIRAGIVIAAFAAAAVVLFMSGPGKDLWQFIQGSRIEIRKVFWPTRDEATRTTVAVIVFALIMGIFFWVLDMGLAFVARSVQGV